MNLLHVMQLLAQEAPSKSKGGGWDVLLLMLLPIVGLFWWMSRSQKKREQQRKDMLGAIKKGDKVVTIGGIHGEVTRLNEREAVVMVDKSKGIELRFLRTAIASTPADKSDGAAGGAIESLSDTVNREGGGES